MRSLAIRLSTFIGAHRRAVIVAWVLLLAAAMPFAAKQTDHLTGGGFDVPGSESQRAQDVLKSQFPEQARSNSIAAVLTADPGAGPEAIGASLDALAADVGDVDGLGVTPRALDQARKGLSEEGTAVVSIRSPDSEREQIDAAVDLREAVTPGVAADGVTTYLVGQPAAWAGLQELSKEDLESSERFGFPIVALILIAVFGSLAAAALPLMLGFVSVLLTGAVIYFLSLQMGMSVFVTNMASMIGIGVAVDYSLFVLARYREELRRGRSPEDARAASLSTSGLAVTFSGIAVVISLAGLWMVDNQAIRSMALGAMVVVAIAICAAVILLPAMISALGHRVEAGGVAWRSMRLMRRATVSRFRRRGSTAPREGSAFWESWTARVMRRPWLSIALSAGVLLTLAIPVLSMKTGTGALDQFPVDHDVVVGAKTLASVSDGGGADPIRVVAEFDSPGSFGPASAELASLRGELANDPEVASISRWTPGPNGASALLDVTPKGSGDSDSVTALVSRMRADTVPAGELASSARVSVGGEAARIVDVRDLVSGSMPKVLAFILGLSFLILMLMLRSVLLPLKAIVMNLLSIGAAYGVLVAVFQWGWLDGFLGFEGTGAIDTINVPLILAVVFGLSMDYEVFLLSRIRERYEAHGDNRRAVAEGLASSAPTISSAALIMTAVFTVFVFTGVPSIKEIGLGNAVAIALDATLVRLVLVPATMQLMGRWNWWLPAWLDRLLPDLGFEREAPAATGAPEPAGAGGSGV